ncbi:hypothetical protein [Pseudomonas phage PaBSM-2607-JFK]|nr:hypothetical protein [Pseudomonas phage PaBSM-2607-JFK]
MAWRVSGMGSWVSGKAFCVLTLNIWNIWKE